MKSRTRPSWVVMTLLLTAAGCTPDDQRVDSVDMDRIRQDREEFPEAGLAQLDSGNLAFRGKDYEVALTHYRSATELMPDNAAAWFGITMAAEALGRPEVADSGIERARALAPGASLIHAPDSSGAMQ